MHGRDDALYKAVQKNDLVNVKYLLSEHADPNVRAPVSFSWMFWRHHANDFRASALRCAVEQAVANSNPATRGTGAVPAANEQAIVVALLDAGAHAAPDDGGQNLLEWTLTNGSHQLTLATEALLKHGVPLPATLSGQPLLAGAINWRTPPATIDSLLRAGADAKGAAGSAALATAYRQWDLTYSHQEVLAILQSLLAAGADPNTPIDQSTMLYNALQWHHPEIVQLLLHAHADPNIAPPKGVLPLLYAALDSKPEVFKELLDAGADPNTHEQNGEPILWYAVIHSRSEKPKDKARKVELLLARGADVHTRWDNGNRMTVQEAAHRDAAGYHIDPAILTLLDRAAAGTRPSR
ncbi:MAG: ankyrin repeat and protein kinase protein 1-like isoform [Chthonomonadales bacterium]|nr:ankyrin repeat and protein kinase protein 1-like isoform [Chthonomonadales bacterium]